MELIEHMSTGFVSHRLDRGTSQRNGSFQNIVTYNTAYNHQSTILKTKLRRLAREIKDLFCFV